jgi:DNA-binding transcriptional LysR family regulator
VKPTVAALVLNEEAEHLFDHLTRLVDRTKAVSNATERFVIGMTDDFVFSPIVARLLNGANETERRVETTVDLSANLLARVLSGDVDLVLTLDGLGRLPATLLATPLPATRLMALARRDHPLGRRRRVTPQQLVQWPLIMMPDTGLSPFALRCAELVRHDGVQLDVTCRSTNSAMTQSLVEQGAGVGIVSEFSVRDTDLSVRVPIHGPGVNLELTVLRLRSPDRRSAGAAEALIDFIDQESLSIGV